MPLAFQKEDGSWMSKWVSQQQTTIFYKKAWEWGSPFVCPHCGTVWTKLTDAEFQNLKKRRLQDGSSSSSGAPPPPEAIEAWRSVQMQVWHTFDPNGEHLCV